MKEDGLDPARKKTEVIGILALSMSLFITGVWWFLISNDISVATWVPLCLITPGLIIAGLCRLLLWVDSMDIKEF